MCLCGRKTAAFSWITFIIWSEKMVLSQTIKLSEASKGRISQLWSVTHKYKSLEDKGRTMQDAGRVAGRPVRLRITNRIYILMTYLLRSARRLRPWSRGIRLLNLLELTQGVVLLFPHVVQITQRVGQVADSPVPFPPQIITQSPGRGQQR